MKDFPMIRSLKSSVIATLAIAVPMLLLAQSPITGIYAALLLIMAAPTACCMAGTISGLAPMIVCALACVGSLYGLAGVTGVGIAAVYLFPLLIGFVVLICCRVPFWKGCGVMIGLHVAAMAAVFLILQNLAGGSLYTAAGDGAAQYLSEWEYGDSMLYQAYAMELISLPSSLEEGMLVQVTGGYALSEAARADLLLSVRSLVENLLAGWVPSLIASQSILGGTACLLLPFRFGFLANERRAFKNQPHSEKFCNLDMPPLDSWHIPRGIGWKVGLALIGGYLLSTLSTSVPGQIAGSMLYSGASALFAIQGAATMNFVQKLKGVKRFWRVAVPILLWAFSLLKIIGILDQVMNIRGLRRPPEEMEDED